MTKANVVVELRPITLSRFFQNEAFPWYSVSLFELGDRVKLVDSI